MDDRALPQRVKRARALFASGATQRAVAAELGVSQPTVARDALAFGLPRRVAGLPPPKKKKLHRALRTTPATFAQLAAICGVSSRTAWLHAQALGVVRRVRRYICNGCNYRVDLRPCQICQARGESSK